MALFEPVLRRVLQNEGVVFGDSGYPLEGKTGLHNLASDRGGLTNYGLILGDIAEAKYAGDLATIPYEDVINIYRALYWDKIKGDWIISQPIAAELMDCAVNCGPATAVRILQEVVNSFNRNQVRYPDVLEDGIMGTGTLGALQSALALHEDMEQVILKFMHGLRMAYYRAILRKDPTQEENALGWIRRA